MKFGCQIALLILFPLCGFAPDKPIFDNGKQTLAYFVQSKLQYPEFSKQHCIQGNVIVNFQLSRRGELKNVKLQRGTGLDLDDEALRLVYLTQGKWKVPADYDTTQKIEIPIDFKLNSASCQQVSKSQIEQSKYNYQSEQVLIQSVMQVYKSKMEGKTITLQQETEAQSILNQLGFDAEYFQEELAKAEKALRKGDVYTAKTKAMKIRYLGSTIAEDFIAQQNWK